MADQLSKEQKEIINNIVKEAKAQGIDPEFAVALANLESGFKHVPASDKDSTAFGPFQVNKATAKANNVDYDEMVKNPQLAIETRIKNIVRHAKNPLFEGDPARIAAAHRYGEGSDFAKTGDFKYLKNDPVLKDYLLNVAQHFSDEQFPEKVYQPVESKSAESEAPTEDHTHMGSVPLVGTAEDKNKAMQEQNASDKLLAAAVPGGVGASFGAVKSPVISVAKTAYGAAKNAINKQKENPETIENVEREAEFEPETEVKSQTPGGKWAKKTGFGIGEGTVEDVNRRYKVMAPDKESKIARKYFEKFGSRKMTDLKNQQEIEDFWKQHAAEVDATNKAQQQAKLLQDQNMFNEAMARVKPATNYLKDMYGRVVNSAPIRLGLGAAGTGFNLADAYQKFHDQNPNVLTNLGGLMSLGGAGASAASMVPSLASKAGPLAMGLTSGSQVLSDINNKDYDAAKANAYIGGLGLAASLPTAIGSLMPTTLNKNEQAELARRQQMAPTITGQ